MNVKYKVVKGKKKYSKILVRFWDSKRIDQTTSVGYHVEYNNWSKAKQRLKVRITNENVDAINYKLNELEGYIVKKYNEDFNSNNLISKSWLKETVSSYFNRIKEDETYKVYFLDWINKYLKELPKQLHNGKPITKNTIKNYKSAQNKLQAFEKFKKHKYKHNEIDLNFHRDFIYYCTNELKLNNNSVGVLIGRIKTFCKNIEFENLPINPIYKHKNFYAPKNDTFDIYLSNDEIESILKHDFKASERLDNARDLFVIALRTGLRVSDISKLSKLNLLENSINITTTKTKKNLYIPIHPNVRQILKKRSGQLPKIISDQKFNKYIKEVAKNVGINAKTFGSKMDKETGRKKEGYYEKWELVTSHTGRRSLATNLYLDGVDIRLAMGATGHKSEKQFLQYVKASLQQHIEVIDKKWNESLKNKS